MQQQNRGTRRQSQILLGLIPAILNGSRVLIAKESVATGGWTDHHGKTSTGVQVNSAATKQVGQSLFIKPEATETPFFSMPIDNAEVMAVDLLRSRGYTVTLSATKA